MNTIFFMYLPSIPFQSYVLPAKRSRYDDCEDKMMMIGVIFENEYFFHHLYSYQFNNTIATTGTTL